MMRLTSRPLGTVLVATFFVAAAMLVSLVSPREAKAGAFCVSVQGIPDQCIYADGQECQLRARQLGGVCSANPREVRRSPGAGQFCIVVGNLATTCIYPDRPSCDADAARQHTACVAATGPLPGTNIDPFVVNRPY